MKRFLTSLLTALLCASFASAQGSKIVTETVSSNILGYDVSVNVYIPAGYETDAPKSYPVIYLLHGLYGTHLDWATQGHMKDVVDELCARGEIIRPVIIMPCAGDSDVHHVLNGYFNVPERRYEDFFFQELIPTMESRYRIKADKEHRAIMGLSMGGGGSTVYAQRHPDMFSSCYAMSAWLDNGQGQVGGKDLKKDKLYYVSKAVTDHSALAFIDNADDATLESLRTVKWFFDCGDDDFLVRLSFELHMKMKEKGVKSELRVRNGVHNWEYWHTALRTALPFASRNFD